MIADRHLKSWRIVVCVVAAVALHFGARLFVDDKGAEGTLPPASGTLPPASGTLPPDTSKPGPHLDWLATGVVVKQPTEASRTNQPLGAVIRRSWSFHRSCKPN